MGGFWQRRRVNHVFILHKNTWLSPILMLFTEFYDEMFWLHRVICWWWTDLVNVEEWTWTVPTMPIFLLVKGAHATLLLLYTTTPPTLLYQKSMPGYTRTLGRSRWYFHPGWFDLANRLGLVGSFCFLTCRRSTWNADDCLHCSDALMDATIQRNSDYGRASTFQMIRVPKHIPYGRWICCRMTCNSERGW